MGPGAKVEDTDLRKVMTDKLEGLTEIRTEATTPRPPGGEDEGEDEEISPSSIDVLR